MRGCICIQGTVERERKSWPTRTDTQTHTHTHTQAAPVHGCISPLARPPSPCSLSLSLSPQPRTRAVFTKRDVIAILQNKPFIQTFSPPPPPAPICTHHKHTRVCSLSPSLSLCHIRTHRQPENRKNRSSVKSRNFSVAVPDAKTWKCKASLSYFYLVGELN